MLIYPLDYFNGTTGSPPKTDDEAVRFWSFRKDRPAEGQSDKQSLNGSKMKEEMQEVHDSLLAYTQKAVEKSVIEACGNENLKRIKDNQSIVNMADLREVIDSIEESHDNIQKLYKILFLSTEGQEWVAGVVDAWFHENNMCLSSWNTDSLFRRHKFIRGDLAQLADARRIV